MTIKEIRALTGLSQSKFAEKYHIKIDTLQNWEQNRAKTPAYVLFLLERIVKEIDYKQTKRKK